MVGAAAATTDAYGLALAALNVVQTICLAWLAARAHIDRTASTSSRDAGTSDRP